MKIIASHNPNLSIRNSSSAGGVFSILAEHILNEGGIVYGATFDNNWNVVHKAITSASQLDDLRRSKYVYSYIGDSIKMIESQLSLGEKVLFSGVPCQIAAVNKAIGDNPNLFLIEVVCHGAPEPKYWHRYLNELCKRLNITINDISNINFRDKIKGWRGYYFTLYFKNGKKFSQKASDNPYMQAFLKDYILRDACFRCPFKYPNGSKADLSIGDFWGIEKVSPQINNNIGTTIVIARTKKGEEKLNLLVEDASPSFVDIVKYNPAICCHAEKPVNYDLFISEVKSNNYLIELFQKYSSTPKFNFINRFCNKIRSILTK